MGTYDNQTNPPKLARIPDTYDVMVQKDYIREFSERTYPNVQLIRLNRDETVVDDLYMEAPARRFREPITLRAMVEHKPAQKALGKYGLDQTRDILVHIPTLFLGDVEYLYAEPNDSWMIGDLVKWGGDHYEVRDQVKDNSAYWGQTNVPFFITLACDYYRHGV